MILAELGARVIKVETPGRGDDSREYGPFVNGKSAYFISVNRGKESIALDLKDSGDRAVFEALLAGADVVAENFRPGTMEKLGYGWDDLKDRHPALIYAACSGFGHTGPHSGRPAYDMVVQAMGGIMSITGQPGQEPTRVGMSIGDIGAGLVHHQSAIVTALYDRARTGRGRKLDIAMLDCQIALCENAVARYGATGKAPGPLGGRHPSITPFQTFRTLDGWMVVAAGNDVMFRRFCDLLDRADLKDDPRYASNNLRNENQESLEAEVGSILAARGTARLACPAGPGRHPGKWHQRYRNRDGASTGGAAQHGGRGGRPDRRPAQGRRQSDQALRLRRPAGSRHGARHRPGPRPDRQGADRARGRRIRMSRLP